MHTFENLFYFKLITFKNTKINKKNRKVLQKSSLNNESNQLNCQN